MRIEVRHTTRLAYSADVIDAVMDVRLGPRSDEHQTVHHFDLRLKPAGSIRRYRDGYLNAAHLVTVTRPHTSVELQARTEVETLLADPFSLPAELPPSLSPCDLADALDPSPLVPRHPDLSAMAEPFRPSDEPDVFEAARALMAHVNAQFTYEQHVTDVSTTVADVLLQRAGVCQDLTHVLIGLYRALGIPARYVSGYIVTDSHGGPRRGAGASHAWAEVFTTSRGWRGFDPTNNLLANDQYVKLATGRDYADVAPTRGTYRGSADERLVVSVVTKVLDQARPSIGSGPSTGSG